jgi:hypothetical protein
VFADVRHYELPPAGLILILDVLQYLSAEEQLALLRRCCSALEPGGRLIFRVHDRERGLLSALTLGLDRLLFSAEHVGAAPLDPLRRAISERASGGRNAGRGAPLSQSSSPGSHPLSCAPSGNGDRLMMVRFMRGLGRLVIGHPGLVVGVVFVMTLFLFANIHNLRTGTDLTDMFGRGDPQWQAASQIGKELGYGNQLFVLVQAPRGDADSSEAMEAAADRLTTEMAASGLFKQTRSGLQEEELLNLVRLFSWHFPSYALPGQSATLAERLDPKQIHQNVRRAATELVTPFSTLGADYFVADPLGLMSVTAGNGEGFSQFSSFDLSWGSGNRFFSRDHTALLIIAEPRESAVDYKFAAQIMQWTHAHIQGVEADPELRSAGVSAIPAGAYVYAEQDHKFIERNIRRVSLVSIIGSLLLCLVVYPSVPLLLLSLLPTSLGILWTTGIASYYPGEVNLISLSFIAILAGLGDDQVVHFFNRSPQEWAKGGSFNAAMLRTFETTGVSIVLCILTAASATVALAASSFKALAEFGFILTVGMFMMMLHTLLTVPALMQLWNRYIRPFAPAGITFRFLPALARGSLILWAGTPAGLWLLQPLSFCSPPLCCPPSRWAAALPSWAMLTALLLPHRTCSRQSSALRAAPHCC